MAEACRIFGISRTRYYEWKNRADRYGLEALDAQGAPARPRCPRPPPPTSSSACLTLAVLEPTIGCRQYADRLGDQGFVDRQVDGAKAPGRPRAGQALASAWPGPPPSRRPRRDWSPRRPERTSPSGSAWPAAVRASWSASTASTSASSRAWARCTSSAPSTSSPAGPSSPSCSGTPDGTVPMRFIDRLLRHYRRHGIKVRAVLSDNGPEYNASAFSAALAAKGLTPRAHPGPLAQPQRRGASASTAPSSKSAGAPPSTAVTSPRSASSRPKPTPGSSPTTAAGATTATTCAVGPLKRSSTTTSETRQHDHHQPQRPSVTSTPGPEALGVGLIRVRRTGLLVLIMPPDGRRCGG